MEQRVSLITLGVASVDHARKFYEALGWKPAQATDDVVFFQIGGAVLALWKRDALAEDAGLPAARSGFSGIALAYNVRARAEADAVLSEAAAAGGKILKPAEETFWGGYSGYFADPDGHLWEVAWNPAWPIDAEGNVRVTV